MQLAVYRRVRESLQLANPCRQESDCPPALPALIVGHGRRRDRTVGRGSVSRDVGISANRPVWSSAGHLRVALASGPLDRLCIRSAEISLHRSSTRRSMISVKISLHPLILSCLCSRHRWRLSRSAGLSVHVPLRVLGTRHVPTSKTAACPPSLTIANHQTPA